jgi:hypothetical protein
VNKVVVSKASPTVDLILRVLLLQKGKHAFSGIRVFKKIIVVIGHVDSAWWKDAQSRFYVERK